ncbi:photosynthetic reaction center subunit H [Tranquillimonas alkanivorans]|uniref:Photosynthetic reaction center H subunit n=1 Tax=Tranquillimonas alkanivorans TaxID=441119 RepID=A0A1I5MYJ5_9RHOB|nr:photosynthetic reaction center subunit H [Tranquillimonas alkanivorans]SFP14624.1 photosynthetic reaction center H subunit [Tranquillimonas alkanivorans]
MSQDFDWAFGLDGAMVAVIFFVIFFTWLVFFHLRREDRREGYPKDVDPDTKLQTGGTAILPMPRDKTFKRPHGRAPVSTPRREPRRPLADWPGYGRIGRPVHPVKDGLTEGVGPAAWQEREDHPDLNVEGKPKLISLNNAQEYHVAPGDPDPRGWPVIGSDGKPGGDVVDIWFNRAEFFLRYFEVRLPESSGTVLLPVFFTDIQSQRRRVRARTIPGRRLRDAPRRKREDQITLLEEDKINAFYAGGRFYGENPRGEARR